MKRDSRKAAKTQSADLHPATAELLSFFEFEHLPPHLQAISRPFHDLAHLLVPQFSGPELSAALRKLLEAKDCAVRGMLVEQKRRRQS